MRFTEREEAVSPVIGVILMVAITVILAAVIAVFVFGLAGDLESSAQKDVTVKTGTNAEGYVTYTIFAGADVDAIKQIKFTNGTALAAAADMINASAVSVGYFEVTQYPKAGEPVTFTAVFNDGKSQVVATS